MQEPDKKPLRIASFAAHATRGILRDRRTRRATMGGLLAVAVIMIVIGSTFGEHWLSERGNAVWLFLFWGACAWLTVTALLLAVLDLLLVRRQARGVRRDLRDEIVKRTD